MHLFTPLLALTTLATHASAVTWYYLDFTTPSGSYITSFSGTMVAPTLPQAATYYLWPGLQPAGNTGVLQQVLDGRSGEWWIGSGWCCSDPSLAWGSGFNGACCAPGAGDAHEMGSGEWRVGRVLERSGRHR